MHFVCINGKFLSADTPLFTSANRGFRYGDGLFETMKLYREKILFDRFHFERLFLGLQLLNIGASFTETELTAAITELAKKNECSDLCRVRLAVFREDDNSASYVIETFPLKGTTNEWNENGLSLTIFPFARKSMDAYANFKTGNFLPYVLAEKYAIRNGFDDAIVLNAHGHLCDSSKANLFLVKNEEFFTPALHQGCINGIIRRFLVDSLKEKQYKVHQAEISEEQLLEADEVFLTNSVYDIRSVKSFKNKSYSSRFTASIYGQLFNFY